MARSKGIRAGRAFVEIFADDSKLVRGLRGASRSLKAFGAQVRTIGLQMAALAAAIAVPIGITTIRAAADAQEALSRFEAVFKDQAKAAGEFADALAEAVGRSSLAIKDALSTFQGFFVGLGFAGKEARLLSQEMQTLALDFASFNNLSDDEAIQRFIAAMSGSSEVMDKFGVNIKQAALQQELLRMGIKGSASEVTEQQKAMARLSIIAKSMGAQGAIGDAVRTSASFTNQMKRLAGVTRDAKVAIGNALLPVVTPLVTKLGEAVQRISAWATANQGLVATMAKLLAGVAAAGIGIAALGLAVSALGSVVAIAAGTLSVLGGVIAGLLSPIGLLLGGLSLLSVSVLKNSTTAGQAIAWLGDRFAILKDDATDAFDGIKDALAAGNVEQAARIMWLSLKLIWVRGVNALFSGDNDLIAGVKAVHEVAVDAMTRIWIEGFATLRRLWQEFSAFVENLVTKGEGFLAKQFIALEGLLDEDIDVKGAQKFVDEDVRNSLAGTETKKEAELKRIEEERKASLSGADAVHQQVLTNIETEAQARETAAKKRLADATKAAKDAIGVAKKNRKAREDAEAIEGPSGESTDLRTSLSSLKELLKSAGGQLGVAAAKTTSQGTFNVRALLSLQTGGPTDQMAKGIDEIAKNTRSLRNAQELSFT